MHNFNIAAKGRNVVGSFSCKCNKGWENDGVTCPILLHNRWYYMSEHHSFKSEIDAILKCICHPVYVMRTESGVRCLDEEEYSSGIHGCSTTDHASILFDHSRECSSGFAGDGFICDNDNECHQFS